MLLQPVSPSDTLHLTDEEATPPKDLPKGDELEEQLDKVLERLRELQQVFYADGPDDLRDRLSDTGVPVRVHRSSPMELY